EDQTQKSNLPPVLPHAERRPVIRVVLLARSQYEPHRGQQRDDQPGYEGCDVQVGDVATTDASMRSSLPSFFVIKTPPTETLGIEHPVMLAGMGGVSYHRLV